VAAEPAEKQLARVLLIFAQEKTSYHIGRA
jgi:hypothetical protein